MKNKLFTFFALSSVVFFAACSEDSSSKTIAEICSDGLSEDCLIGTWTMTKIVSISTEEVLNNLSQAPGTMSFGDDGIYIYNRSNAGSCPGRDKGEWSISEDGKSVTFNENKEGDCIDFGKKFTATPTIEVRGDSVIMKLNKVIFQQDESDGNYEGDDSEVFTRTE